MITLNKVNKYFNKNKKNEIHVINDTSIEFEETGLVALLGPSGCGKTTLLNAIGGLDKINSGSIYINGKKMPKRDSNKKDELRVLNIGYIFQDYNLLDHLTVYDNIALSLKMIGIKNKEIIKERVNYILEVTGMYRYRNKPAANLSGGQRQRVGIARALVKNPKIIIADEPTGNLDSKNTIEIMNIIKAISKDRLVILVTHEKDLAYFYASRIIELQDGVVQKSFENIHENELDYRIDNKIYLKDFKVSDNLQNKTNNVNIYKDTKDTINLDIVFKNGNIYIKSNDKYKIEVVDEDSNIEFIDDNYKKISKEDYEKNGFDLKKLDNSKFNTRYTSIYNIYTMLKTGFKKVSSYTVMKKVLLIGFFVAAMFISYSISSIFGITKIRDENFVKINKNYIYIQTKSNRVEEVEKIEKLNGISYVLPSDSIIRLQLITDDYYQLLDSYITIDGSLTSSEMLKEENLLFGRTPKNRDEIVLDKMTIDRAKKNDFQLDMINIGCYKDYINRQVKVGSTKLKIVGISDEGSPSIYTSKEIFYELLATHKTDYPDTNNYDMSFLPNNLEAYSKNKDAITIKEGHSPENNYEIIVPVGNKFSMPLNKEIDMKVGEKNLVVVGYYQSNKDNQSFYANDVTIKYNTIVSTSNLVVFAENKEEAINKLQNMRLNAVDSYQNSKDEYIEGVKDNIIESLIISGILLVISFVEIFLMIRASFLSRIKEVGIYRAIGVKKIDIYKMFLGEILIITTIAGLTGSLFMSAILNEISKSTFFAGLYVVNTNTVVLSVIIVYILNILVGLLPIRNTISKTPAAILSRTDVD